MVSPEWGTSARWKAHTVGPPCPQVPYPRLVEFTDAEPADTEGRLYAIVLCKGLELQKFWCPQVGGPRGVSWNQSSADEEGQLFEGARVISGGGYHLSQVQAWECGLEEARQESGGLLIAAGGQVGPAFDGWCCWLFPLDPAPHPHASL